MYNALDVLPIDCASLLALFEAADKYDVTGLATEAAAALDARAGPPDVASMLEAASVRGCAALRATCERIAAGALRQVLEDDAFCALCVAAPDLGLAFVADVTRALGMDRGDGGVSAPARGAARRVPSARAPPPSPPPELTAAAPATPARPPPAREDDPPTPEQMAALDPEE